MNINELIENLGAQARINPSIKFLISRIENDNYRGEKSSQHNRYEKEFIIFILQKLFELSGTGLMEIRTTDLKKQGISKIETQNYTELVRQINQKFHKGTEDSIRKNIFVDMNRMQLINRYDKNRKRTELWERSQTKYVSISDLGLKLINENKSQIDKDFVFSRALNNLLSPNNNSAVDNLYRLSEIYKADRNQELKIDIYEYMFFISFINQEMNGKIYTLNDIYDLLVDYKALPKSIKIQIIENVKKFCDPNEQEGNKTNKRDFHNWKNKIQQIFMILAMTVFFERNKSKDKDEIEFKMHWNKDQKRKTSQEINRNYVKIDKKFWSWRRSNREKTLYFEEHKVTKQKGFELHHIIPISNALSAEHFKKIDNYKNMIYISGTKHNIITQSGSKYQKIDSLTDKEIVFINYVKEKLECLNNQDVYYNYELKDEMLKYNNDLLNYE